MIVEQLQVIVSNVFIFCLFVSSFSVCSDCFLTGTPGKQHGSDKPYAHGPMEGRLISQYESNNVTWSTFMKNFILISS